MCQFILRVVVNTLRRVAVRFLRGLDGIPISLLASLATSSSSNSSRFLVLQPEIAFYDLHRKKPQNRFYSETRGTGSNKVYAFTLTRSKRVEGNSAIQDTEAGIPKTEAIISDA